MKENELIAAALSECLEALRVGGDPGECIRRYPHFERELRELVALVRRLPNLAEEVDRNLFGGQAARPPERPRRQRPAPGSAGDLREGRRNYRLTWLFQPV